MAVGVLSGPFVVGCVQFDVIIQHPVIAPAWQQLGRQRTCSRMRDMQVGGSTKREIGSGWVWARDMQVGAGTTEPQTHTPSPTKSECSLADHCVQSVQFLSSHAAQ